MHAFHVHPQPIVVHKEQVIGKIRGSGSKAVQNLEQLPAVFRRVQVFFPADKAQGGQAPVLEAFHLEALLLALDTDRHKQGPLDPRVHILQKIDIAEALHRVISDVAAETIATLGPSVLSTDLSDSDIITIDYAISHADAAVACLRTNIETAIVCATLARITAAADLPLAQWYASLARIADTSLPGRIARC